MAAAGSLIKELCEETTCPICLGYFTDPVTTDCGHNFCRACLTQSCGEPSKLTACPECREPLLQNSFRPNRKLANIAEISKKVGPQEAMKAGGAGLACEVHQEPLKLFCMDDEALICVVCDRSKEHRQHQVIPVGEAAQEFKTKIEAQLVSLELEKKKLVELKETEEQRNQESLKQLEEQKQEITSIFKEMHKFLEEKEHLWLSQLGDLEEAMKKKQEEYMTRLSEEISYFSDLIKDLEVKLKQQSSEFLQDIRCTMRRCQDWQARQCPKLQWRLGSCCPSSSVLKKAMEQLTGSLKQAQGQVSVTLDPDTAHPRLVLSEDLKRVRRGNSRQNLPDNPERFDKKFCMLGRERFTSGRHCWEMEVEQLSKGRSWAVGVARESVRTKESFIIIPNEGIWAVGKELLEAEPFLAMTSPELTPLSLSLQPKKVRVILDYEEGRVEFLNADTDDLIFTFMAASFSGEGIRPFLWVKGGVRL